jgi:hypothetical protein
MATFDSAAFSPEPLLAGYRRADVELHGVDQAVPSYEGRIFLNRPEADRETPLDHDAGYLGSFFVFGKVTCWGEDDDHCAVDPSTRKFDRRRNPTRYAKVRVRTPDGLVRRLAEQAGSDLRLNVVAVIPEREDYTQYRPEDVLRFDRLSIVTYA